MITAFVPPPVRPDTSAAREEEQDWVPDLAEEDGTARTRWVRARLARTVVIVRPRRRTRAIRATFQARQHFVGERQAASPSPVPERGRATTTMEQLTAGNQCR